MNTRLVQPPGRARARARVQAAFTLMELVVSVALMSIILGVGYACLSAGVSSRKLVEARSDVVQTARVAMALITADLRAACPLSDEFEFIGMSRRIGDIQADNLDFGTHNHSPRAPHEGDFAEISYFLERQPESGQFSLWRRRDPYPDPEPLSGGTREEIARGLVGLQFEYFDGFDWFDQWGDPDGRRRGQDPDIARLDPNLYGLPEAVRITMWFSVDPPSTSTHSSTTPLNAEPEPPMVFRTVARLNLAPAAALSQTTGTGGTGTGTTGTNGGRN
jgi:prepilin-type N-terminal cleavage/methylation domain-containing protein